MKILALSTSSAQGSAALLDGAVLLAEDRYDQEQLHAERIFAAIDTVLARAAIDRAAVEAIACDVGPGSFTGVRAGLAAAKGMALALGRPIVGVGSLAAMAAAALAREPALALVGPSLDAKRGERFIAVYARSDGAPLEHRAPRHVPAGEAAAELGAVPATELLPSAEWIGRLASIRLARGERDELATLEPVYLRSPDATPMASPPRWL